MKSMKKLFSTLLSLVLSASIFTGAISSSYAQTISPPPGGSSIYVPPAYSTGVSAPNTITGLKAWYESDTSTLPVVTTSTGFFSDTACSTGAQLSSTVKCLKEWTLSGHNLSNTSATGVSLYISGNGTYPSFQGFPGGRGFVNFLGTSTTQNWLKDQGSASFWNFLNNGPVSGFFVIDPTDTSGNANVIFDTGAFANVGPGTGFYYQNNGTTEKGQLIFKQIGSSSTNNTVRINFNTVSSANAVPPNVLQVVGFDFDGTTYRIWSNNAVVSTATAAGGTTYASNNSQSALILGDYVPVGLPFKGNFVAAVFYNKVTSDAERLSIHQYFSQRYGVAANQFATLGNSITAGTNVLTLLSNISPGVNTVTYPSRLNQYLGTMWNGQNFGVSGAQSAAIKSNQADLIVGKQPFNTYIYLGGINDMYVAGNSAAQAWGAPLASSGVNIQATFDEITNIPNNTLIVEHLCPPALAPSWGGGGFFPGGWNVQYDALNAYFDNYVPPSGNKKYYATNSCGKLLDATLPYTMLKWVTLDNLHPAGGGYDIFVQDLANFIHTNNIGQK